MKVNSMTGFARHDFQNEDYQIIWEIKSVNNRFKDFRFRVPSFLARKEIEIRKSVESHFFRGSFDISCEVKKLHKNDDPLNIDFGKVRNFIDKFKSELKLEKFSPSPQFFSKKEFLKTSEDENDIGEFALSEFDELLLSLKKSRNVEGQALSKVLEVEIDKCVSRFKTINELSQKFQKSREEKLTQKFEERKLELNLNDDKDRFQKEVIYYLEKLSIDEELDRAEIHFAKLKTILHQDKNKAIGREIEFLLQELNRETNTIGSKSSNEEISSMVVETKVSLEKMREQALNIE